MPEENTLSEGMPKIQKQYTNYQNDILKKNAKNTWLIINFININKICDNLLFKKQAKSALIKWANKLKLYFSLFTIKP